MAASNRNNTTEKHDRPSLDGRWASGHRPEQAEKDAEKWTTGKVKRGDSLGRILKRERFEKDARDALLKALKPHMDFKSIRAGQTYRLRWENGALLGFEYHFSKLKKLVVRRNAKGKLVAKTVSAKTEVETKRIGGRIDSSLYNALKAQGEDGSIASDFVDVFAYDLNFYVDSQKGDVFKMIVEKEFINGKFLRYGRILAAEYDYSGGTARAFYFRPDGKKSGGYYDASGRSVSRTLLKTPLKYARISSRFDRHRMHPILHRVRAHLGTDFAAPKGTPVWAAADGKIVFRGRRHGGGNVVILRHKGGLHTLYMHLSTFRKGQRVGQMVESKTVIGYVGSTGLATGPHLHFSVKKNGRYVDPQKIKMKRGPGVPPKYRGQFDALVARWSVKLAEVKVARNAR